MTDRSTTATVRLLIAEDVDLVAEAFEALLSTEPGFEVVARVGRGDLVLPAVLEHRPDVAVLEMCIRDRLCAVLALPRTSSPGSGRP